MAVAVVFVLSAGEIDLSLGALVALSALITADVMQGHSAVLAIGAGLGVGLATFYLARLLLQRTPLVREPGIAQLDERGAVVRRPRTAVPGR
jgi:ribose/xylose/arabinose/galactoside ABC-type transport system permease subunit